MPLQGRKIFTPAKPLSDVKDGETIYTIKHTKEQFRSKKEYDERVKQYNERIWTCQCTGHINLSHEEALRSENEKLDLLKKQFPQYFEKPVLEVVHHSTEILDILVDQAWTRLQQAFVIGEMVALKVKSQGKIVQGNVVKVDTVLENGLPNGDGIHGDKCNSPSSDKENSSSHAQAANRSPEGSPTKWTPPKLLPYRYHLRLEDEDKIVSGVPAHDLQRVKRTPSKDLVKLFIRSFAMRLGTHPHSPWTVNPDKVKKYNIPSKFIDFLVSPSKVSVATKKAETTGKKRKASTTPNNLSAKKAKLDGSAKKIGTPKNEPSTPKKSTTPNKSVTPKKLITPKKSATPKKATPKKQTPKKKDSSVATSTESEDSDSEDEMTLAQLKTPPGTPKSNAGSPSKGKTLADIKRELSSPKKKEKSLADIKRSLSSPNKKEKSLADIKRELSVEKKKRGRPRKEESEKKSATKKPQGKSPKKTATPKNSSTPKTAAQKDKKGMKQMTLFDMKGKPKTPKSPMKTPVKKSPVKKPPKSPYRLPPLAAKLKKAMQKEKNPVFYQLVARCAKELSKKQIDSLPDELKEPVLKKWADIEEKKKIATMTPEERDEYMKKKRIEVRRKLAKERMAQNKKFEDKELKLKPLPTPKLVPTPDGLANEQFGDVMMVTDFINCFKGLLMADEEEDIKTEDLMKALVEGMEGCGTVSRIFTTLLQTLLQDGIAEDYKELSIPLSSVTVTPYSVSELVRLCLRKLDTDQDPSGESDADSEDSDNLIQEDQEVFFRILQADGIIEQLETEELYMLSVDDKIKVLTGLCMRIMGTYSVQDYMEEVQRKAGDVWKRRIAVLKQKNDEKREKKNAKKLGLPSPGKAPPKPEPSPVKKVEKKDGMTIKDFYGAVQPQEDDDLVSIVKRRRVMSEKAKIEKAKKDEEERLKREKEYEVERKIREEEALEQEFYETTFQAKNTFRHAPLGTDRNHSRYWVFRNAPPGLYVEKGWAPKEIEYSVKKATEESSDSSSSDSDSSSGDESEGKRGRKSRGDQLAKEKTQELIENESFPHIGQNLWFVYDTVDEIDALMKSLHHQGVRESALHSEMKKVYDNIVNTIKKPPKVKEEKEKPDMPSDLAEGLRQELMDMEMRLRSGGLGGVDDFDTWEKRLQNAVDLKDFGVCLLESHKYILDKFLKGLFTPRKKKVEKVKKEEDDEEEEDMEVDEKDVYERLHEGVLKWTEAIENCQTFSRLHFLMGMLYSCVKWEKSAEDAKCKICRKKGDEDRLLLCDECNQAFHMYCLRPTIIDVPQGDWYCPACIPRTKRRTARETNYRQLAGESSSEEEEDSDGSSEESGEEQEENCALCGGDEDVVPCSTCPSVFHLDCHEPPLRRPPRAGTWSCMQCRSGVRIKKSKSPRRAAAKKKNYTQESDSDEDYGSKPTRSSRSSRAASRPTTTTRSGRSSTAVTASQRAAAAPVRRSSRPHKRKSLPSSEEEMETDEEEEEEEEQEEEENEEQGGEESGEEEEQSEEETEEEGDEVDSSDEEDDTPNPKALEDILIRLGRNRNGWPFIEAVDRTEVPDYYDIIKKPMDFDSMRKKIKNNEYTENQQFIDDIALVFTNAEIYNQPDSEVVKCIIPLEKEWRKMMAKSFAKYIYPRDAETHEGSLGDHIYSSPQKGK